MKRIIREGVFESNSSSSHSISIMKEPQEYVYPEEIHFEIHEFHDYPWDDDDMSSLEGRANYLYACAIAHKMENEFKKIMNEMLPSTRLIFDNLETYDDEDDDFWSRYLINQAVYEDVGDLLYVLMQDEILLLNYLLDDTTEVALGRDGSEWVTGGEDRFVIGNTEEREGLD